MGMGFTAVGIADDASAVFHNPGGLAYNDKNTWYAEIYANYAFTNIQYKANSITDKSDEKFIIPGFFVSKTFNNWAFGFGSYIPFAGGGTAYDNFQNSGQDLEFSAGWNAFTAAAAYKLNQSFSIGGGISIYTGEMETSFGTVLKR